MSGKTFAGIWAEGLCRRIIKKIIERFKLRIFVVKRKKKN